MNPTNKLTVNGNVRIERYDSFGNPISNFRVKNMVVDTGLEYLSNRIMSTNLYDQAIAYVAIGDGVDVTTPAIADMTGVYKSYVALHIKALTPATASTPPICSFTGTFLGSNTYSHEVNEIGLFTDLDVTGSLDLNGQPTIGDPPTQLIARALLNENNRFTKGPDEYIKITWHLSIGN